MKDLHLHHWGLGRVMLVQGSALGDRERVLETLLI